MELIWRKFSLRLTCYLCFICIYTVSIVNVSENVLRSSQDMFFFSYVILRFRCLTSHVLTVDCWRAVWQLTDLHCAGMGLHQAAICCPSHEHLHVEQPFHRATSHVNWWTWNFSYPAHLEEISLWGLWERCNGWTLFNLLNRKTLHGVAESTRWQ